MSEPNSPIVLEEASPPASPATSFQQRPQRRRSTFFFKCLVVVSILGNAVLATIVVLKWSPKEKTDIDNGSKSEAQRDTKESILCFTCDFLGPDIASSDTVYSVFRMPRGTTMCCLNRRNKVAALFQKILKNKFKPSPYALNHEGPTVSEIYGGLGAHLYMTVHGSVVHWTSYDKYNTAFCSGLVCSEGNITITKEGTYLVYSFISIQNHFISDKNLVHIVYRKNPILARIGENKLLFGKSSPGRSGQQTSFMAAILHLRNNDVLRVGVSANYYSLLDKRPLTNYFGVIKV